MPSPLRRLVPAAAVVAALIAVPAAAPAADRVVTLPGYAAPGTPSRYDVVRVLKQGPAGAKRVLVLEPGTAAGAPSFRPVAADLLRRLPGWQVWSVDRRENALEDQSAFDRIKRGATTPQALFDYYLGWIGGTAATGHFAPRTTAETAFARGWGMRVAVEDLRRVVRSARAGGRRVVLGGHSLGATIAVAYATWDFAGRPGGRDLSGLVLVDGGGPATGARPVPTPAQASAQLAALAAGDPFLDLTGTGLPWAAGVFNTLGSTLALGDPNGVSPLQDWAFLPKELKPPVRVDNRGAYGYALDTQTGPRSLALVQQHLGRLEPDGALRGWIDGELGTVARAATAFSGIAGMDGSAWYHPRRLSLDAAVVHGGLATPAQATLGVRATRGRDLDLPIYAFETSLGKGRVLAGARRLARQSRIARDRVTLVDRSATFAHVDPLTAVPEKNDLVATLVPFLARTGRPEARK